MVLGASAMCHARYGGGYVMEAERKELDRALLTIARISHRAAPAPPKHVSYTMGGISGPTQPTHRPAPRYSPRHVVADVRPVHRRAPEMPAVSIDGHADCGADAVAEHVHGEGQAFHGDALFFHGEAERSQADEAALMGDEEQLDVEETIERLSNQIEELRKYAKHRPAPPPPQMGRGQLGTAEMISPRLQRAIAHHAGSIEMRDGPSAAPSVHILVEMCCRPYSTMSVNHDPTKYTDYYDKIVEGLTGTIQSPVGRHCINVRVSHVESIEQAPAVWDHDGHGGTIPANIPFVGGADLDGNPRIGAFEIYLCTNFPGAPIVPRCTGLHSKLRTRNWPNVKNLSARIHVLLGPVFNRWHVDEQLEATLPTVVEAAHMRAVWKEYRGKASVTLIEDVAARLHSLDFADAALVAAMDSEFDPEKIGPLKSCIEEHGESCSHSVASDAAAKLDSWIAIHEANTALRAAPADQEPLRRVIEEHRTLATPSLAQEMEERLHAIMEADDALRAAMQDSIAALRLALPHHRAGASPGMVNESVQKLAELEMGADASLRAEGMSAVEASGLRSILESHINRATPPILAEMEARLKAVEAADVGLTRVLEASNAATRVLSEEELRELTSALSHARGVSSRSLVDRVEAKIATTKADMALIAAPSDQSALRAIVEEHSSLATVGVLMEARARLSTLEVADTALLNAMEGSIKGLRLAIPEHRENASPELGKQAVAKLEQLEVQANASLLSEAESAVEASDVRVLLTEYADRATAKALTIVASKLDGVEGADSTLLVAMEGQFDPDAVEPLRACIEKHGATCSPNVLSRAQTKLAAWVATHEANDKLRAAPPDQEPLRQAIEDCQAHATPALLQEMRACLDVIEAADNALRTAMCGSTATLKLAIPEYRGIASPGTVSDAEVRLEAMTIGVDVTLSDEIKKATEASHFRALHNKYCELASDNVLATVKKRVDEMEAADELLRESVNRCTKLTDEPEELAGIIESQRSTASPSVTRDAETAFRDKLIQMNFDANKALVHAPASAEEQRQALEANRKHATESVLRVTKGIMNLLEAVNGLRDTIKRLRASSRSSVHSLLLEFEHNVSDSDSSQLNAKQSEIELRISAVNGAEAAVSGMLDELSRLENANVPRPRHKASLTAKTAAYEYKRECEKVFDDIIQHKPLARKGDAPPRPRRASKPPRKSKVPSRSLRVRLHQIRGALATKTKQIKAQLATATKVATKVASLDRVAPYRRPSLVSEQQNRFFGDSANEIETSIGKDIWDGDRPCLLQFHPDLRLQQVFYKWADVAIKKPEEEAGPPPYQLPTGWQEFFDTGHNLPYYVSVSGKTVWEKPMSAEDPLPEGWRCVMDDSTGLVYYITELGQSTWHKPNKHTPEKYGVVKEWRALILRKKEALAEAAARVLPPGWVENYDRKLRTYFYSNSETGEVTWERPKMSAQQLKASGEKEKSAADIRSEARQRARHRRDLKLKADAKAKAEALELKEKEEATAERAAKAALEAEEKAKAEEAAQAERAKLEMEATEVINRASATARRIARIKAIEQEMRKSWKYDTELTSIENMKEWMSYKRSGARELFKNWDKDGNGYITKAEFEEALPALGFNMPPSEMEALFNALDDDGSGEITLREMDRRLRKKDPVEGEVAKSLLFSERSAGFKEIHKMLFKNGKKVLEGFKKWDDNKNGMLSKAEFRNAITKIANMTQPDPAKWLNKIRDKDIDELFDWYDTDSMNSLSISELEAKLLKRPKPSANDLGAAHPAGAGVEAEPRSQAPSVAPSAVASVDPSRAASPSRVPLPPTSLPPSP